MELILKYIADDKKLIFEFPDGVSKDKLLKLLGECVKNSNGYAKVSIGRVYRQRTTGERSQNNLFHFLCSVIAQYTGNDMGDVKNGLKDMAVNRGYPYYVNPISRKVTGRSSASVDTVQMSMLIDTAYQYIAENDIPVPPNPYEGHDE